MMPNKILDAINDSYSGKTLPTTFIDSIDKRKHIVLFYEDPEHAKIIQFRFIKKGLEKGETGIFLTNENIETIKHEMQDFGIDTEKYKMLLRIFPTLNPLEEPKGPIACITKDVERYSEDLMKPSRLTGNWTYPSISEKRVDIEYEMDAYFHDVFEKYDCSVLCCYALSILNPPLKWTKRILQVHHSAIFTHSLNGGIAFDM